VGERQPHRADLLPSRRQTVEDAARDDEVGTGVVVREREAETGVVEGGCRPEDPGRDADEDRETVVSAQGASSLHSA
jgi:hypothetical protein